MRMVEPWIRKFFVKRILHDWETWGFKGVFIYGAQGSGKTILMLKILAGVYDDWHVALDRMFFTLPEFGNTAKHYIPSIRESKDRFPAIGWDDAGVYLSKFKWQDWDFAEALQNTVELARRFTASFILTATHPKKVMKVLRDSMDWWFVEVKVYNNTYSSATVYENRLTPTGRQYARKIAEGFLYKRELPRTIYQEYQKRMRSYTLQARLLFEEPGGEQGVEEKR
ncbi:MAG: hypothetical protein ACP5IE_01400 [Infirmifilum sp.]